MFLSSVRSLQTKAPLVCPTASTRSTSLSCLRGGWRAVARTAHAVTTRRVTGRASERYGVLSQAGMRNLRHSHARFRRIRFERFQWDTARRSPVRKVVARQSGWARRGDQDGDSLALGVMIVAPDCCWQAARSFCQACSPGVGSVVGPIGFDAGRALRVVAARWR